MPKTIYLPKEDTSRSGINITWTPTRQNLSVGGWYDSYVGIESTSLTLSEFFMRLGITQKDCEKAFKPGKDNLK